MNAFALAQSQAGPSKSIRAIVDQHVDEARHRRLRRDAAARSAHLSFGQRLREDEMLTAHLHGLVLAGEAAHEATCERCRRQAAPELFVTAWTRFIVEGLSAESLSRMLRDCAGDSARLTAVCEALRWPPLAQAAPAVLMALLASATTELPRAPLIELCAKQRWAIPDELLDETLDSQGAPTRAAGHSYCASFGRQDRIARVMQGLADAEDLSHRTAAAGAALRLGDRQRAVDVLMSEAWSPEDLDAGLESRRQAALADLCAALPLADARDAWHGALRAGAPVSRLLAAAEASGDPLHVPWLVRQLEDPAHAEDAIAALSWLLGDWEDQALAATGSLSSGAVNTYVASRPWPSTDTRWLWGQPIGKAAVFETLLQGPMRFRHHAARHLAMVTPDSPDLDMDAPAPSQLLWLYEAESALEGD